MAAALESTSAKGKRRYNAAFSSDTPETRKVSKAISDEEMTDSSAMLYSRNSIGRELSRDAEDLDNEFEDNDEDDDAPRRSRGHENDDDNDEEDEEEEDDEEDDDDEDLLKKRKKRNEFDLIKGANEDEDEDEKDSEGNKVDKATLRRNARRLILGKKKKSSSKKRGNGRKGNEDDEDDDDEDEDDFGDEENEELSLASTGIKITPFNIDEEMTEGRYDEFGNYHLNKKDNVADAWADSIDWNTVSSSKNGNAKGAASTSREMSKSQSIENPAEEPNEESDQRDATALFSKLLQYMIPTETVNGAIRRLGGQKLKSSNKTTHNKGSQRKFSSKMTPEELAEHEAVKAGKQKMLEVTELAENLVERGYTNVYSDTYESIEFQLKHGHQPDYGKDQAQMGARASAAEDMRQGAVASDVADSLSSAIANEAVASSATAAMEAEAAVAESSSEVMWEYKWGEAGEIYGPFPTSQMISWQEQSLFESGGVLARKVNKEEESAPFYKIERIEFDLYS